MVDTSISNMDEFVKIINVLTDTLIKTEFQDEILLFRGHPNIDYELLPSIARKNNSDKSYLTHEKELITKAIGKNPNIFSEDEYAVNLLVKLQHFGIPTRLLDVTYNAFVALYFACVKDDDKDGEVIVFKVASNDSGRMQYFNDDYVNVIANMYKALETGYPCDLEVYCNYIGYDYYGLHVRFKELHVEEELSKVYNYIREPLFVSPVELSERQKRQQGAFIIFPNNISEHDGRYSIMAEMEALDKSNDLICARICIPKEKKKIYLSYLQSFGITEEFLFPDSTDIICRSITQVINQRIE